VGKCAAAWGFGSQPIPTERGTVEPVVTHSAVTSELNGRSAARDDEPVSVRVLVADRVPLYAEGVARAVARDPRQELVARTRDGYEAIELIGQTEPHVAVLELALRGLDGLAVLNAIARDHPSTRVIFVSATADPAAVYAAVVAGASGYVTKQVDAEQLCSAIATVANGGIVLSPDTYCALASELRLRAREDQPRIDEETRQILTLTADGCDVREIGAQLHLAPSTIKARVRSICKALGVSTPTAAAVEAVRRHLID
jgi:DNA-binding NarL/FixJ family response regulator